MPASPQGLAILANSRGPDDRVALEATGNALAIARALEGHVARVVVATRTELRAITEAKVKTDRRDARTVARLLAAGLLHGCWLADEQTRALRRRLARRAQLVRQRTRGTNEVHAVLLRTLRGRPPMTDASASAAGRGWPRTSCPVVRVGDEVSAKGFIHHVDLAVTDVERSLAFYRDLLEPLGWTDTVRYPTYRGSEEVVYLQHPATKCGLGIRPADSDGYQYYGVGIEHLAFEVDEREEVDAAHARCAERGDNIHFPPEEDRDIGGYYAFFVFDPDGMRIEIFSWPR